MGAWAQTDVTSTYITNADFSSTDGWTAYVSASFKDYGNGLIGTYGVRTADGQAVSTVDATHLATEYCFGFECRWESSYAAYQQTTTELPVGHYELSFDVENTNSNTQSKSWNNLFYVQVGENKITDTNTEWMSKKSSWTTHTISFDITAASTATISLGYGTGSNNIGSANTPTLHVSHLKLTWTDPLDAAKANLQTVIDAAEGYNTSLSNATLTEAINNAKSVKTSATTESALSDAIVTLNAAVVAAVAETNEETTVSTALFVANNSFETGDFTGWIKYNANDTRIAKNEAGTYFTNDGDGDYLFNTWDKTSAAKYIKQTLTNLPEGYYTVTALVASDAGNKVTLYAGESTKEVETSESGKEYFVEGTTPKIYVEANGSLEIGATSTDWYKADNFRLTHYTVAAGAKEALAEAIASAKTIDITTNVGTGVFQKPTSAKDDLLSAIETAEGIYSNPTADYKTAASDLAAAVAAWNNVVLNAPAAEQLFNIVVAKEGHAKYNNPIIIIPGASTANNPTGYALNCNFEPNTNLSQAFTLKQVDGNNYKISAVLSGSEVFLTNGSLNGSAAGWSNYQIQATTDAEKAMSFKIAVSETDGAFNIINPVAEQTVLCQDGGNIYTDDAANGAIDFKLVATSKPSISFNTTAAGWGTVMLPFAVAALPTGVKAYTCAEVDKVDETTLTLVEVDALEANKPYIIEGAWEATNLTGDAQGTALTVTEGLLTGVYDDKTVPVGSYVLLNEANGVGFYKVVEGKQPTATANRAYLTLPAAAEVKEFFALGGSATAIRNIVKIQQGQTIYNLAGQRMNNVRKGVNIIGGKKVVIK